MITCSHCHQTNRIGAFYCKHCGSALACPRCRVILDEPAGYCDNCGQALASDSMFRVTVPAQVQEGPLEEPVVDSESTQPTPLPTDGQATSALSGPRITSDLGQFVPQELLAKLEAARRSGEMVGERRVVTMLFCDVKGSTAAAELLDPEEWTEIINGAFEYMIKPVYKYEGTVARLMGDGILAFFGAPISHEDDPQRAVLAGLDIAAGLSPYRELVVEQWGLDFDVRVGINTGLVVVGAVGSDLRMEYTAMGDAINMAARMEQTAIPGTVQIAHDTYKLVKPLFEFEELGGIKVKGKEKPVIAYRVLGRKAMTGQKRGIEGNQAEIVGRDLDLTALQKVLSGVQQGVGRIVCVIGEAGLGKSRLIKEAKQSLAMIPELASYDSSPTFDPQSPVPSLQWFESASLSYESNQPYGLFQRLIRRLNQISPGDSAEVVWEKTAPILDRFEDGDRQRVFRVLEALFDLKGADQHPRLEGEDFKRELYNIMPIVWRQRFSGQPAVIAFDDIHWSDPASIDLLLHLFPLTAEIPLILLCAFRPNRHDAVWRIKTTADEEFHHQYTEINLRPLSDRQVDELVNRLLTIADLPENLRSRILERASGNPFFVEEVVRSLIDSGALIAQEREEDGQFRLYWQATGDGEQIDIPDNLQALLTARIDRLEDETRRILQMAAVIGRSFYKRVLEVIGGLDERSAKDIERQLNLLLRLEMIQEAARIPELEYKFSNPLTQEVTYQTILLKRRRDFHNRVGLAMEALFPQQLSELAPHLAYHFQEGGNDERALDYFTLAGDNARRLYANTEAIAHYDRALEIARRIQASGKQLIHLVLNRGRTLEHMGAVDQALAEYEELASLAEERQDDQMKLSALVAMGTIVSIRNMGFDPDRAELVGEQGLTLAHRLNDRAAEAKVNWNLMQLCTTRGRPGDIQRAIAFGEASLALSRELDLREQMALTLNNLALAYRSENQISKSSEAAVEAQHLFEEIGNLPMLADSYAQSATIQWASGAFEEALELVEQTGEIARSIGNLWNQGAAPLLAGIIYLEQGDIGRAISTLNEVLSIEGMAQVRFIQTLTLTDMADAYLDLGSISSASPWLEEARQVAEHVPYMQSMVLSLEARIHLARGEIQAAQELMESRSEELNKDSFLQLPFLMHVMQTEAEVALALDDPTRAEEITGEMIEVALKFKAKSFLPEARRLMGEALLKRGESQKAKDELHLARQNALDIGNRRALWKILVALADLDEDGDYRAEAREVVNYIAEHAGSEENKGSFLNRPDVKSLLIEPVPVDSG